MRTIRIAPIWLAGLLVLFASIGGAAEPAVQVPSLVDPVTGGLVALEPTGPVLHVVFFATWCPACLAELDVLQDFEARWSSGGYRLVLVAVGTRQSIERLAQFRTARRSPGKLLFDQDGSLERAWAIGDVPTHVILDATGKEVARRPAADAELAETIDGLLSSGRRR